MLFTVDGDYRKHVAPKQAEKACLALPLAPIRGDQEKIGIADSCRIAQQMRLHNHLSSSLPLIHKM
jgi:hypothetical protein